MSMSIYAWFLPSRLDFNIVKNSQFFRGEIYSTRYKLEKSEIAQQ